MVTFLTSIRILYPNENCLGDSLRTSVTQYGGLAELTTYSLSLGLSGQHAPCFNFFLLMNIFPDISASSGKMAVVAAV